MYTVLRRLYHMSNYGLYSLERPMVGVKVKLSAPLDHTSRGYAGSQKDSKTFFSITQSSTNIFCNIGYSLARCLHRALAYCGSF